MPRPRRQPSSTTRALPHAHACPLRPLTRLALPCPALPPSRAAHLDASIALTSPSAPAYASWASSAAPAADVNVLDVFLFNCTNPDDVLAGATPQLEQLGPLTLWQRSLVHDVSWSGAEGEGQPADVVAFKTWRWLAAVAAEEEDTALTEGERAYLQRRRAAAAASSPSGSGSGGGSALSLGALSLGTVVTSLYMPLVTLVAHGYGPQSWEEAPTPGAPRVPGRLRRLLTGECDGSETARAAALSSIALVTDEFGCRLPAHEARAVATLRAALGRHGGAADGGRGVGAGPYNTLFVVRRASQLLFGYDDPIFAALHILDSAFPPRYPGLLGNTTSMEQSAMRDGAARMYTGGVNKALARTYLAWDGMGELYCCATGPCGAAGPSGPMASPAWAAEWANAVGGASATQFRRGLSEADVVPVFVDSFVRSMLLSAQGAGGGGDGGGDGGGGGEEGGAPSPAAAAGIPTLRFAYDAVQFANAAHFPPNAAFHSSAATPDGLLNTTTCSLGRVPLFYSKPYFLGGNATLNAAAGLPAAQAPAHDTWYDVEPTSGKAVAWHWRHQMNVFVDSMPMTAPAPPAPPAAGGRALQGGGGGGLFPSMNPLYFPLLWVDGNGQASQAWADDFVANVMAPTAAAAKVEVVGGVLGGLALAAAAALLLVGRARARTHAVKEWAAGVGALMEAHAGSGGSGRAGSSGARGLGAPLLVRASSAASSAASSRRESGQEGEEEEEEGEDDGACTNRSDRSSSASSVALGSAESGAFSALPAGTSRTRSHELLRQLDRELRDIFWGAPVRAAARVAAVARGDSWPEGADSGSTGSSSSSRATPSAPPPAAAAPSPASLSSPAATIATSSGLEAPGAGSAAGRGRPLAGGGLGLGRAPGGAGSIN